MKRIKATPEQFEQLVRMQKKDLKDVTFECPSCKKLQKATDFMEALNTNNFKDVEKIFITHCIGRFKPSKGCGFSVDDYVGVHEMEIVYRDGTRAPVFIPRTKSEQRRIYLKNRKSYAIKDIQFLSTVNHVYIDYIGNIYRVTTAKSGRLINNTFLLRLASALKENEAELDLVKLGANIDAYKKEIESRES